MIRNDYEWKTTYHREAAQGADFELCKALYEERIRTLENYISSLEAQILLLRKEAGANE